MALHLELVGELDEKRQLYMYQKGLSRGSVDATDTHSRISEISTRFQRLLENGDYRAGDIYLSPSEMVLEPISSCGNHAAVGRQRDRATWHAFRPRTVIVMRPY